MTEKDYMPRTECEIKHGGLETLSEERTKNIAKTLSTINTQFANLVVEWRGTTEKIDKIHTEYKDIPVKVEKLEKFQDTTEKSINKIVVSVIIAFILAVAGIAVARSAELATTSSIRTPYQENNPIDYEFTGSFELKNYKGSILWEQQNGEYYGGHYLHLKPTKHFEFETLVKEAYNISNQSTRVFDTKKLRKVPIAYKYGISLAARDYENTLTMGYFGLTYKSGNTVSDLKYETNIKDENRDYFNFNVSHKMPLSKRASLVPEFHYWNVGQVKRFQLKCSLKYSIL